MSKACALSGIRAAYLCGPQSMMRELRRFCPPWSVSLPGQIAACEALRAADYYRDRWQETHVLRHELAAGLTALGWEVVPGCANFLLCHLPEAGPMPYCSRNALERTDCSCGWPLTWGRDPVLTPCAWR